MQFFSDNAAPVHPQVMQAIIDADAIDAPYDGDALSQRLDAAFSEVFETEVTAIWVATGTAANCLALAALCPPHKGVICHRLSHIEQDECGAPGFYTHGAKLMLVEGEGAKVAPNAVTDALAAIRDDVHQVQAAALSVTNGSEYGLTYSPEELAALGALCDERGLGFHCDGARFANAVASQNEKRGASPADLSWRAGVDALSFGCVKNGGMNAEALILFDRDLAKDTRYRLKRAGHLMSKGRYMAAQLLAMLEDDLWLANARAANAGAALIAQAAGKRLLYPVEANEVFLTLGPGEADALRAQGFDFYDWGVVTPEAGGQARFVTSWSQDAGAVQPLADAIAAL
ncbi:MAG: beta-eliminating lyase-related protein [Pseudomonadota bacterium]